MSIFIAHAETKAPGIVEGLDKIIPGGFANIFSFSLQIGLAIAFGTIIYAGFLYLIAGDNPSKTKEANAWIMAAVEGLIILAGAFILLNTISPKLTTIKEVEIPELELTQYYPKSYSSATLISPSFEELNQIKLVLPQVLNIVSPGYPITSCPQVNRCISGYSCNDHIGIDFGANRDAAVTAAGEGTVSKIEKSSTGYGNLVIVDHEGGFQTYYAHLQEIDSRIKVGADVNLSQLIGKVGSTGKSTGPHLHFEIRKDGTAYNTSPLFLPTRSKTSDSGC